MPASFACAGACTMVTIARAPRATNSNERGCPLHLVILWLRTRTAALQRQRPPRICDRGVDCLHRDNGHTSITGQEPLCLCATEFNFADQRTKVLLLTHFPHCHHFSSVQRFALLAVGD